jgi:uncharacterized repeat protein (TIGR03803 family)
MCNSTLMRRSPIGAAIWLAVSVVSSTAQTNFTLSRLHCLGGADGAEPWAPLLQASNGMLYGSTWLGGANGQGTLFRIPTNGMSFELLRSFSGATNDGGRPLAALIQGSDGALYGTTMEGGVEGCGTVFKMQMDGSAFQCFMGWPRGANTTMGRFSGFARTEPA